MPHLVAPITATSIPEAIAQLRAAYDFIAAAGRETIDRMAVVDTETWGQTIKRVKVRLRTEGRPSLVLEAAEEHSFAEVANQCATMERLLDALKWAAKTVPDHRVVVCHPTTSSSPKKDGEDNVPDNDLVLQGGDGYWLFEVSDVASAKADGNSKERKDLAALGVLNLDGTKIVGYSATWPDARLLLVVSDEFASRLLAGRQRRPLSDGRFDYEPVAEVGPTRIIEVQETTPRPTPA